jgi:hypothetical protein
VYHILGGAGLRVVERSVEMICGYQKEMDEEVALSTALKVLR